MLKPCLISRLEYLLWAQFQKKVKKKDQGEIGINIKFGGISIESGNWAYADESGILISKEQLDLD